MDPDILSWAKWWSVRWASVVDVVRVCCLLIECAEDVAEESEEKDLQKGKVLGGRLEEGLGVFPMAVSQLEPVG